MAPFFAVVRYCNNNNHLLYDYIIMVVPTQAKVKVIVRVRPLLPSEGSATCIHVNDNQVRLSIPLKSESYGFKYVHLV